MNKPFRSRFFIIILSVGILLSAGAIASRFGGFGLNNAAGILFLPLQKGADYLAGGIDGIRRYVTEFDRLKSENAELRQRLASMQSDIESAEKTLSENEWLRNFYGLKRENENFQFLDAQVIARRTGNVMTDMTVDKGTFHGVKLNCPVMTDQGVIGYVTEIGATWSRISTLLAPSSGISAYIRRTGDIGVIESTFERSLMGEYVIRYLPEDSDIQVGDVVISSGLGSVYPKGLVVGTIAELLNDELSHMVYGVVRPVTELADVKKVMIILGSEISYEE